MWFFKRFFLFWLMSNYFSALEIIMNVPISMPFMVLEADKIVSIWKLEKFSFSFWSCELQEKKECIENLERQTKMLVKSWSFFFLLFYLDKESKVHAFHICFWEHNDASILPARRPSESSMTELGEKSLMTS